MSRVRVYNSDVNSKSIVLFNVYGLPSSILADKLDEAGIAGRAGYHCAPLAHELIGTNNVEADGAMRISVGIYNSKSDCSKLIDAVNKIAKEK